MEKTDLQRAVALIEMSERIVIVGHVNPDADTLGCAVGLYGVLRAVGKRPTLFNATAPLPPTLAWLPHAERIRRTMPKRCDLVITVDCADLRRVGADLPQAPVLNIDHHATNEGFGEVNLIDPSAVSTACVATALVQEAGWPMPPESAEAFYAALAGDSGFFGYEGVGARTFALAQTLIEVGADAVKVATMLRERQPLGRLRLIAEALRDLRLYLDGRVAGVAVTREMMRRCGGESDDTDAVVAMARSLATVEMAFLSRQEPDGSIKFSLRSKGAVNVAKIAREFGGGGHVRAAGFIVAGDREDEAVKKVLALAETALNESKE